MKKILLVFGTRPEAIKMVPVVKRLKIISEKLNKKENKLEVKVCVTAQHREMLDQVLDFFEIKPDYDLNLMKPNQDLYDITSNVLLNIKTVLDDFNPDIVLVHGDTTTTFTVSLSAFYKKIKVGHIEAGLRTYNLYSPWPEEANRELTGVLASYNFAPTKKAKENLLNENKSEKSIIVTGNTVIDALFLTLDKIKNDKKIENQIISKLKSFHPNLLNKNSKLILITAHRRENFGEGFINICEALKELAKNNPNVDFIYPVHLNPNVQKPVTEILSDIPNIHLITPLDYVTFIYLMNKSYLILTDSGGIQEEAPSLGKPVLVLRNTTERPEALDANIVKLVGTNKEKIINETQKLLDDPKAYEYMSKALNPYGDGKASERIVNFLVEKVLNLKS